MNILKKVDNDVYIEQFETYSSNEIKKYIELFYHFKSNNSIIHCDFEDNTWVLYNEIHLHKITFDFNELEFNRTHTKNNKVKYEGFINAVKCFVLIKYNYFALRSVVSIVNKLKKIIHVTNFFNDDSIKSLTSLFEENIGTASELEHIMDFIYFFSKLDISDRYEEILITYNDQYWEYKTDIRYNNRDLPNLQSVFEFSDILDHFIVNSNLKEREKFYPIIIWWKLTTIIPLRTTELMVTPKNCLSIENDKCFITVRRTNLKGKMNIESIHSLDAYYLQKIEINSELYNLINQYYKLVDKYDQINFPYGCYTEKAQERKFMFSYRSYFSCNNHNRTNELVEFFTNKNFLKLLPKFLKEVVQNKYGRKIVPKNSSKEQLVEEGWIEKIQPMDTRHLATINLIMQGYTPIIIKRLSGHKSIESCFNYYNHLPKYIRCWTYNLAKKKIAKQDQKEDLSILQYNITSISNVELKYKKIFEAKRSTDLIECNDGKGVCSSRSKDRFDNCKKANGICEACNDFYLPSENGLNDITNRLQYIDDEIEVEVEILKGLISKYMKNPKFEENYQISINKLHSFINQGSDIIANHSM